MNAADIIAFTADADLLCPACAERIYGASACGRCPQCRSFLFPLADDLACFSCGRDYGSDIMLDHEGDPLWPVFVETGLPSGSTCHKCRKELSD
jgi:hypothetical protein